MPLDRFSEKRHPAGGNPTTSVPDAPNDGPTPSPWSIEARLFLFDLALEHELNVTRAEEWLQPAVDWLKTVPPPGTALKQTVGSLTVSPSAPNAPLPLQ